MKRRTAFPVGVASVALCVAGCAQLAGIDATSGKDRTADSLALQRVSIGNTVVTAPLDLTGLTASFLPDDGAAVAATSAVAGTWRSTLPDPAPIEFTVPDVATPIQPAYPRRIDLGTSQVSTTFIQLEHPAPAAAPTPASLAFTVPLDTPTVDGQTFQYYVVGAWVARGFAAGELPAIGGTAIGPVTVDYGTSLNLSGRPQLTKITTQDALVVLRYVGSQLTGVSEAQAFTQTGTDTVTTPAMTAVAADLPVSATLDPTNIAARFSTVRPAVNGLTMSWSVSAAPGGAYGFNAGPSLQGAGLPITATTIDAKYGNPFASHAWPALFTFVANEARAYMPPGMTIPAILLAQLAQLTPPGAGLTLDVKAGLVNNLELNGTLLSLDGVAIAKPTTPVQVTFETDNGQADLYVVQLIDFVANDGNTELVNRIVLSQTGTAPAFALPPELLQPGHYYTLRVITSVGSFPNVKTGDLQARTLPLAQSLFDSAVFTVSP